MSNTIINNHPAFICHYHDFQLPSFNPTDRDIGVLISQINGCYMRGDVKTGNIHYDSLVDIVNQLRVSDHGNRMADEYLKRVSFYLDNNQELGSKYILKWLEQKLNR